MDTDTPVGPKSKKIVVGIDDSQRARSAALWAADEADRHQLPLLVVLGADLDRLTRFASFETVEHIRSSGRSLLLETLSAVKQRFPDLTVAEELSFKEPVAALHTSAGPRDTIVIGSRGRGGFRSLKLGSVSLGVAAGSAVPVIVVRDETERPETGRVTAAVHGPTDAAWLARAAQEAQVRKASLRLLSVQKHLPHVGSEDSTPHDVDAVARRRDDVETALVSGLRAEFPRLDITADVETGRSAAAVLVEASLHTDLLVLGARRSDNVRSGLGRVAHTLLHHSHCPVEVVPRRAGDDEEE